MEPSQQRSTRDLANHPGGWHVAGDHAAGDQLAKSSLQRIARSAQRVLGQSTTGREVLALCDDHAMAREAILTDRSDNLTVIAVVGATGQGKSWLVRQFVPPGVAALIASGNHRDEATEKLIWVGPQPPADLDVRHETYVACAAAKMRSVGIPYLIVDAPGATDDRRGIADVAKRALSIAAVMLVVVRRDQIRSQQVTGLMTASEGTIVVPVVNAIRRDPAADEALRADIDALTARLRAAAPQSIIAKPVLVEDFETAGRSEPDVANDVMTRVSEVLLELVGDLGADQRRGVRLAALDDRFHAAVASVLQSDLPDLTAAVDRLDSAARQLPGEVASMLLGDTDALQAAIRRRLRALLMNQTSMVCFPYRSILGVLNLTNGAWDRVALSLTGSLPSLIGSVVSGLQNVREGASATDEQHNGLRRRASAAVTDRLAPMARRFREELRRLHSSSGDGPENARMTDSDEPIHSVATLAGIDSLQEGSRNTFEATTRRYAMSTFKVGFAGFAGTVMCWLLLAGPLVNLYQHYFAASSQTLRDVAEITSTGVALDDFPKPSASFLLTSWLLSILPTSIFAMVIVSFAQSRRRVAQIAEQIRQQHADLIDRLQGEDVLRLAWSDPLLEDAEYLLSIGRRSQPTRHHDNQESINGDKTTDVTDKVESK
ncbi:MAG: hypothetical protein AAGC97_03630 [Planctomycetota bacterium]